MIPMRHLLSSWLLMCLRSMIWKSHSRLEGVSSLPSFWADAFTTRPLNSWHTCGGKFCTSVSDHTSVIKTRNQARAMRGWLPGQLRGNHPTQVKWSSTRIQITSNCFSCALPSKLSRQDRATQVVCCADLTHLHAY